MQTVLGVFDDSAAANQAAASLKSDGFEGVRVTNAPTAATSAGSSTAPGEGLLGEIGHFFSNLFEGDDKAHAATYSEAVRRGGYVVSVDVSDASEADRAADLLEDAGAYNIDDRAAQWRQEGWQSTPAIAAAPISTSTSALTPNDTAVLPVVEEELKVGKRTVDRGGVRVVQRVTETPVSESINLTEEHASIERRHVDRVATAADLAGLRDMSIEVRETAEEAVVAKQARVVEEVVVGKVATEHAQTVSDTVKRTDVDVERFATEPAVATTSTTMTEPVAITPVPKGAGGGV